MVALFLKGVVGLLGICAFGAAAREWRSRRVELQRCTGPLANHQRLTSAQFSTRRILGASVDINARLANKARPGHRKCPRTNREILGARSLTMQYPSNMDECGFVPSEEIWTCSRCAPGLTFTR